MGETLYNLILGYFTSLPHNIDLDPQQVMSNALLDISMVIAYCIMGATFMWFTTKSVLMRGTTMIYMFAAIFFLCATRHLGDLLWIYPMWLELCLDFVTAIVALTTAVIVFQRRHLVLSNVYQFKYVVGLLKTLDKLEEVDPK